MTARRTQSLHTAFLLVFGSLLLAGYLAVPVWPGLAPAFDLASGPLMAVPGSAALLLVPSIVPEGLADLSTALSVMAFAGFVGLFLWAGWQVAQSLTDRRTWPFLGALVVLGGLNALLGSYALQVAASEGWSRLAGVAPAVPVAASIAAIGLLLNGLFYSGWWLFGHSRAR